LFGCDHPRAPSLIALNVRASADETRSAATRYPLLDRHFRPPYTGLQSKTKMNFTFRESGMFGSGRRSRAIAWTRLSGAA
jgi:hypothetical protein